MSASAEFLAFATDLFSALGPVRARRMFGGAGLHLGDAMFGLIADDTIYLRTDPSLAQDLEAAGAEPFVYEGKGRRVQMPYWRLPEAALDEPDEAVAWARRALVAAEAAAVEKRAAMARKAARGA